MTNQTNATKQAAMKIAAINGRDWADMGAYEREEYMDEARKQAESA